MEISPHQSDFYFCSREQEKKNPEKIEFQINIFFVWNDTGNTGDKYKRVNQHAADTVDKTDLQSAGLVKSDFHMEYVL